MRLGRSPGTGGTPLIVNAAGGTTAGAGAGDVLAQAVSAAAASATTKDLSTRGSRENRPPRRGVTRGYRPGAAALDIK